MTTNAVFTLTCRKCNSAYALPLSVCASCGPTIPLWEGHPSEHTFWVACGKCHACLQGQGIATRPEPQDCPDCGTPDHGWRDAQGNWWDAAQQQTLQSSHAWVSGQFDGNYDGALVAGQADGLSLRSYTFTVREAVLSGIQPLASPPLPVDSSGLAPLRLPIVRNVHVIYHGADGQPRYLLADLHDFRLHAWGNASTEQVANGRPLLAGRFWGTAYARLSLLIEPDIPPTTSPSPVTSDLALVSARPAGPMPAQTTMPPASEPARDAADSVHEGSAPTQAPLDAPGDQPATSAKPSAFDALLSPSVTPSEAGAALMDADRSPSAVAGESRDTALPYSAPVDTSSPSKEDIDHGGLPKPASPEVALASDPPDEAGKSSPQAAAGTERPATDVHAAAAQPGTKRPWAFRYGHLRRRLWGDEPFFRPWWPLLLGAAGMLLWLVCGWPIMLLGLGALLLQRALHLALFKQWKWPSPRWRPWVNPLPMLVLALCAFLAVIARSNSAQCLQPGWLGVGVLALLLFLSALARARFVAVIIGALWILALLAAFRDRDARCGQSLTQSVRARLHTAGAHIERQAKEMVAYDQDADIVSNSATKNQGEQRVSLAQALEHPSHYFSCDRTGADANARPIEIYLGESALFGFNSDRLNAEAEANLGKLSELIAHNPHASIVLTGHTDKLGLPLPNIKLSEQRAKRVADWLVTHKVVSADQIDVRGAGDRDPVVDDPALYRMNRRVEMHIDCPQATSAPATSSTAVHAGTA